MFLSYSWCFQLFAVFFLLTLWPGACCHGLGFHELGIYIFCKILTGLLSLHALHSLLHNSREQFSSLAVYFSKTANCLCLLMLYNSVIVLQLLAKFLNSLRLKTIS